MLRHPTSIALNTIVNSVTADGCVHIAEAIGSRRELVVNSCTHRRCNATVLSCRRCVLGLSRLPGLRRKIKCIGSEFVMTSALDYKPGCRYQGLEPSFTSLDR